MAVEHKLLHPPEPVGIPGRSVQNRPRRLPVRIGVGQGQIGDAVVDLGREPFPVRPEPDRPYERGGVIKGPDSTALRDEAGLSEGPATAGLRDEAGLNEGPVAAGLREEVGLSEGPATAGLREVGGEGGFSEGPATAGPRDVGSEAGLGGGEGLDRGRSQRAAVSQGDVQHARTAFAVSDAGENLTVEGTKEPAEDSGLCGRERSVVWLYQLRTKSSQLEPRLSRPGGVRGRWHGIGRRCRHAAHSPAGHPPK
ncbi:hypothetical protein [Actinoplanes friuliensis]|uniref:hypothetical protein n=1 Tax=Actinoplanes friuliensis TaxID=196914 RepID=UPI001EE67CE0|nr:hypothetical protein [Actinoplanes friuliensis]